MIYISPSTFIIIKLLRNFMFLPQPWLREPTNFSSKEPFSNELKAEGRSKGILEVKLQVILVKVSEEKNNVKISYFRNS